MLTEGGLRAAAARHQELIQLASQPSTGGPRDDLVVIAVVVAIVAMATWGIWALFFGALVGAATWLVAGRRYEARRRLEFVRFLQALDSADSVADARARVLHAAAGSGC